LRRIAFEAGSQLKEFAGSCFTYCPLTSVSVDRIEGALGRLVESLAVRLGERLEIIERSKTTAD
jgi:hypothetical protein